MFQSVLLLTSFGHNINISFTAPRQASLSSWLEKLLQSDRMRLVISAMSFHRDNIARNSWDLEVDRTVLTRSANMTRSSRRSWVT